MSRICDICGKGAKKGNKVARGIGNRVTNRSITKQRPNLRNKKMVIGGTAMRVKICTSCLSRLKKDKKDAEAAKAAQDK